MGHDILWIGLLMGMAPLLLGYFYWRVGKSGLANDPFYDVDALSQLALALALRSERDSLFQIGFLSNKAMLGAVVFDLGAATGGNLRAFSARLLCDDAFICARTAHKPWLINAALLVCRVAKMVSTAQASVDADPAVAHPLIAKFVVDLRPTRK